MSLIALGKHNPRLAEIRTAVREGSLTPDGLLPVEGWNLIVECFASGLSMPEVYVRKGTNPELIPLGSAAYELDDAAFQKIQSSETSQGVVGLVKVAPFSLNQIVENPRGPIVILASLQDPGNVGTILRTSEAFEAAGCVALPETVSVYNAKTVRASTGSVFRMPHVWNVEFSVVLDALRSKGIRTVATAPRAVVTGAPAIGIEEFNWSKPTAFIVGNEGNGIDPEISRQCDGWIKIAHNRKVESLNSAIATSIVLYESYRQRGPT